MSNAISEKGKIISGSQGPRGRDGLGIKSVDINQSSHLIVTYDDDTTHDAGLISGGSGGSDAFIITISGGGTEQNPYVANKTPAEVTAAVNAGKVLYIRQANGSSAEQKTPVLHYGTFGGSIILRAYTLISDNNRNRHSYNVDVFTQQTIAMLSADDSSWETIAIEVKKVRPQLYNNNSIDEFLTAENEGKIAQYVGEGYNKGRFYQCVEGEAIDTVEEETRSIGVKALTEPEPESDRHFVLKPIFVQPSALVIKATRREGVYDFDKTPQEVAEILHTYSDGWSGVDVRLAYEEDDPYILEEIPLTGYQFVYDDNEDSDIINLVFVGSRVFVDDGVGTEVIAYTIYLTGNLTTNKWDVEEDEASLTGTFSIQAMAIGVDQNQNPIIELDKTPAEVQTALEAGMTIEVAGYLGDYFKVYLTSRSENGNYVDFYFGTTSIYNATAPMLQGGWMQARYNINDSSTWVAIYADHLSFPWPQRTNMLTNNAPNGAIVQYVGETDANYTNGYFYKRRNTYGTYGTWERIDVQPSSGGGSGTCIITITVTGLDPSTQQPIFSSNKTPAEVEAAYTNGQAIIIEGVMSANDSYRLYLTERYNSGNSVYFYFGTTSVINSDVPMVLSGWGEMSYDVSDDTTWTYLRAEQQDNRWPQSKDPNFGGIATDGIIVQYIGPTTSNRISGYFYKYSSSSYSWSQIDVQPSCGTEFVESLRNIGIRLLDEPSGVSIEYVDDPVLSINIKWTDPSDINTYEPVPATWAGTVVVRKEGSAPKNVWDGTIVVDSTTKNAYSSTALADNNVNFDTTYYYGIFPYHVVVNDANHPIKHYRFTKVVSITTPTLEP